MSEQIGKIYIVGLGAGSVDALTLQAYRLLKKGYPLYLRTERHPAVELLKEENINYIAFDDIYDQADNFDQVYEQITAKVIDVAKTSETAIIYAVPGHPMVAERSVKMIRQQAKEQSIDLEIVSSSSFLDDMFNTLNIDPNDGFMLLDGLSLKNTELDSRMHTIITQVYNREVASDVKLILMEYYPDDMDITVVRAAGVKSLEKNWVIPIYELDRIQEIDHLTAIYLPKQAEVDQYKSFGNFIEIVNQLRAPDGCPWDQEQTHESLREYLIEETYEVLDAIDNGDMDNLAEELGDILLHIVMHSLIADEEGHFNIFDVVANISKKMIRRHPHVFNTTNVNSVEQVLANWDEIKKQEKTKASKSVLDGIPKGLPALMYAFKQQKKAAKVGFDWDDIADVWAKVTEELQELKEAVTNDEQQEELGDLLFAVVNLARFIRVNPEIALKNSCLKFNDRFQYIEQELRNDGAEFTDVDLDWMEHHWQQAKIKLERR